MAAASDEFRSLIELCGLTNAEAGEYLGYGVGAMHSKTSGRTAVKPEDMRLMAMLWFEIQKGGRDRLFPAALQRRDAVELATRILRDSAGRG